MPNGQQPIDGRVAGGELGGRRMHDVVDEVAAAIGVVADEGAAGRQVGMNGDQAVVDAVGATAASRMTSPKASSPTAPTKIARPPQRAAWSMKMPGAPLG